MTFGAPLLLLTLLAVPLAVGLYLFAERRRMRYAVRYTRGREVFAVGARDAPLTLDCELRGRRLPPLGPAPRVASRVGLERNPVDLRDPDARDWLRALTFPDHVARFARLDKAIEAFDGAASDIRAGDALSLLPDALAAPPADAPVCVYHTLALYQFTEEMRQAFDAILTLAGVRRPVWRISLEGTLSGDNPLLLYSYRDGRRHKRTLARCNSHGAWLEWLE